VFKVDFVEIRLGNLESIILLPLTMKMQAKVVRRHGLT